MKAIYYRFHLHILNDDAKIEPYMPELGFGKTEDSLELLSNQHPMLNVAGP